MITFKYPLKRIKRFLKHLNVLEKTFDYYGSEST